MKEVVTTDVVTELCNQLGVPPIEGEAYEKLVVRIVVAAHKLAEQSAERSWEALPTRCQDWLNKETKRVNRQRQRKGQVVWVALVVGETAPGVADVRYRGTGNTPEQAKEQLLANIVSDLSGALDGDATVTTEQAETFLSDHASTLTVVEPFAI